MTIAAGTALDVDANGYVYLLGAFNSTAWFGQAQLNAHGSDDIFIARIASDGSVAADPWWPTRLIRAPGSLDRALLALRLTYPRYPVWLTH